MGIATGTAADAWGIWFADDPRQMSWQRFLGEVAEAGYDGFAIVAQDMWPVDLDRTPGIAKPSRAYLREIGMR